MPFNQAEWAVGMMIDTRQWADNAMYARRALDALQADKAHQEAEARPGKLPFTLHGCKLSEWEREVLTRQLMRYVLAYGTVPSTEHVKKLQANARDAKRAMPSKAQIRLAYRSDVKPEKSQAAA